MTSKNLRSALALGLAFISFAAYAQQSNVPKNLRVQAAPGACQAMPGYTHALQLRGNALALVNVATTNARVACAPQVDVSGNGNTEVGLYISNNDGGTVTRAVTCVMTYNTAGQGPKQTTGHVMVSPGLIGKMAFNTNEMIVFGGPVSFVCELPPRTGVMRVYTISQQSS